MQDTPRAGHTKDITEAQEEGANPTWRGSQWSLPNHSPSNKCFFFLYFPHIIFLVAACLVIKKLTLKPATMASDPQLCQLPSFIISGKPPLPLYVSMFPPISSIKWNNSTYLTAAVWECIGLIHVQHFVRSLTGIQ